MHHPSSFICRPNRYLGLFLPVALVLPSMAISAQASDLQALWGDSVPEPPEDIQRDGSYAFRDLWESIFKTEPPEDPQRGGSRGSYFCLAEPGSHDGMVWSDRPTLVWQGPATAVGLYSSDNPLEPIWTQAISEANHLGWIDGLEANGEDESIYQVTYDGGDILTPGETYVWKVQQPMVERPVYITMMPTSEHQEIAADLEALELELENEGLDGDAIALRKASFFATQNLWNDFWYQISTLETPSEEVAAVMEAAVGTWCPPSP